MSNNTREAGYINIKKNNNEYDDNNEYSLDTGQDANTQFNRDIFQQQIRQSFPQNVEANFEQSPFQNNNNNNNNSLNQQFENMQSKYLIELYFL